MKPEKITFQDGHCEESTLTIDEVFAFAADIGTLIVEGVCGPFENKPFTFKVFGDGSYITVQHPGLTVKRRQYTIKS